MKNLILLFLFISFASFAQTKDDKPFMVTKTFDIYITDNCSEFDTSCDDVTYHSVNRKNHQEITLKGKTITTGQSNDFKGYDFKNGEYLYRLLPDNDGDKWSLYVIKEGKTLLQEQGTVN